MNLTDVTLILPLAKQIMNQDLLPSRHNEAKTMVYTSIYGERVRFDLTLENSPFMENMTHVT